MGKCKQQAQQQKKKKAAACLHMAAARVCLLLVASHASDASSVGSIRTPARSNPRAAIEQPNSLTEDEVVRRWGLEFALMDSLRGGEGSLKAGDLFRRYGPAYLLTSTSLALVSYAGCYAAVSRGVNVAAILARFGMTASVAREKTAAASIAYVCHKAASPLRFPPTVVLTPVVAARLFARRPALPE